MQRPEIIGYQLTLEIWPSQACVSHFPHALNAKSCSPHSTRFMYNSCDVSHSSRWGHLATYRRGFIFFSEYGLQSYRIQRNASQTSIRHLEIP